MTSIHPTQYKTDQTPPAQCPYTPNKDAPPPYTSCSPPTTDAPYGQQIQHVNTSQTTDAPYGQQIQHVNTSQTTDAPYGQQIQHVNTSQTTAAPYGQQIQYVNNSQATAAPYGQQIQHVNNSQTTAAPYGQQIQYVNTGYTPHTQQYRHDDPVHSVVYPGQQSHVTSIVTQPEHRRTKGNCPMCSVGIVKREFTEFGLLLGIILFPFGILYCMKTARHRCSHCNAVFETPPT